MTDLQISVRLKADGSGLVGQLQQTKTVTDQVKGAFGGAAAEARQLSTQSGGLQRAFMQVAAGARAQKAAVDASTNSARQNRAAYQQLGFQVQDVFAQMAGGVNPLVILAQQGGQTASAMTNMGGKIGGVASFLAGPFGAAVFGAVTVVGLLATSLLKSSGSAEAAALSAGELAFRTSDGAKRYAELREEAELAVVAQDNFAGSSRIAREEMAAAQGRARAFAEALRELGVAAEFASVQLAKKAVVEARGRLVTRQRDLSEAEQLRVITAAAGGDSAGEVARQSGRVSEAARGLRIETEALSRATEVLNTALQPVAARSQATIGTRGGGSGRGDGGGGGGAGLRGVAGAAGEASAAVRELVIDMRGLEQLDPFAAAQQSLAGARKRLNDLAGEDVGSSFDTMIDGIEQDMDARLRPEMEAVGRAGAEAFRSGGVDAAQAIAQVLGGKVGDTVAQLLGAVSGLQTGNFNSVGGPLGGFLTLLVGDRQRDPSQRPDAFTEGLESSLKPVRRGLDKVVETIGSALGGKGGSQDFARQVGAAVPYVAAAYAASSAVSSLLGNDQRKGGKTLGPLSPFLTALFAKPLKGGATITNVDDAPVASGNSSSRKSTAVGLAGNVQSAIAQIAEALGGELGDFAVSIGLYKDRYRINPSGGVVGGVKGSGAIDFGKDGAQAAMMAAIADALADGGVKGLSDKVQAALRSSPDIDKALKEALKVDELETLLGGLDAALGKGFRDFERQAADRRKVAAKYGFDLVKLEELTGKDRLKMFEDVLGSRTGALKSLLDDLNFGELFEGSLTDQRQKLLVEIAKAEGDAKAGVTGAADTVANLRRRLLDVSRDAFGTAGGELAADRASSRSAAEEIIRLENERVKAAQDAAIAANVKLDKGNELASETNDLLAEQTAILRSIAARSPLGGGGASSGPSVSTARQALL